MDSVFMADLNKDNIKEIYVTYHSTGKDNYGNILGITKSRKKKWISIYLPETSSKQAIGYTGNDKFMLENNMLLRKYIVTNPNNKLKNRSEIGNLLTYTLTRNNKLKLKKFIGHVKNN